jgi:ABC-type multidrug transport system ATPase subunit
MKTTESPEVKNMLVIEKLSKQYPNGVMALNNLNLSIQNGILGLLGPNGAGKSTLMRILATINKPSSGRATWQGHDIAAAPESLRPVLGYLPQDFGIYPHLNAVEFLRYLAAARGINGPSADKRIHQLLELVNMLDASKRPLGTLSGGMRQRVGIAQALLNDPRLLIVDEPTAGLDPEERVGFRHLLTELSGDRVVILSSHIVSDIEATATDIAIINKGRLICHERPETLLKQMEGQVWELLIPSSDLPLIKSQYQVSGTVRTPQGIRVRLIAAHKPEGDALPLTPSLEEAYLSALARDKNGQVHP